jgi:hypothetical protein
MKQYYSCNEFYYAYVKERKRFVTIEDIDNLIEKLVNDGYRVRVFRYDRITVHSPDDIKISAAKRKTQQAMEASRYTKLGAAFPKEVVSSFSEACRSLKCTQSGVLMPIIMETIKQAGLV